MRASGKGNAACWNCKWYEVIDGYVNGTFIRTCSALGDYPMIITVMPMRCEKKEKAKE